MSDQAPPYGGHPNYPSQWPPAYPSMLPSNFPVNSDYSHTNRPPSTNPGQPFDYNMASVHANSQIPGPAGLANPALFFPPQFPFYNQFDASKFPPPFPPMPFAPIGYSPAPIPPGASDVPLAHQNMGRHTSHQPLSPAVNHKNASASAESHREEGELSEEVDERSLRPSRKTTRQYSDLEEGETVSDSARSASSGSPYNPPLSVSADPIMIDHVTQSHGNDPVPTIPQPQKSIAQLRIQAQGALLGLAPHNIRYEQLVAEGINPVILRRLYEEVGIKVTLSSQQDASAREKAFPPVIATAKVPGSTQPTVASVEAPSKSDKPLERKELIARMLAEKAAKAASKEASPTGDTKSPPVAPVDASPPVLKEPTVKEKSKAQTELARQRIEELKKQTLLKTQQLAQASAAPTQLQSPAPAIQHPLPLRPPVPDFRRPASLPGLHMSERGENFVPEPVSTTPIDLTPSARINQRKRPRASDFDEPAAPTRKTFNPAATRFNPADKLIIAISDDESLYGDDEDDNMELDSSPEQDPAPILTSAVVKPQVQTHHQATRASTSTPQAASSLSDQGDIRLKDMEIQAMRRKIAELELRRKSKLAASRTQSPRTVDESGASSSSGGSSSVAAVTSEDDSLHAKQTMVSADNIVSVAPVSQSAAVAEGSVDQESPGGGSVDEVTNGTTDSAARESASFISDSAGSAMDESDDSSSDSSESSSESEEEPASPAAQVDATTVPAFSEPIEIDSSEQSVSPGSSSAIAHSRANSVDEPTVLHHSSVQSQREMSAESDGYEPPEPDNDAQSEGSSYSPPPFSPVLPGLVETTADPAPAFDTLQVDEELTNAPQISESLPRSDLQVGAPGTEITSDDSAQRFTPYTSPLRTFQAYRYHPHYTENVPSGHRSLTYSHDIDSLKYMCPFELSAGGRCNDKSCVFQHFRDITLSDDDILVKMGSVREGKTDEEKESYFAGLKEIINDLRRDKVKDFNTVASEIAAYRRRFLQDPSRVLSL